ncbi:MAG: tripartite tricarboxylate transporter substrate binding protein, partial [Proteobacteria bacterium]|nr:tripartite tricarboxylate transporter substrate binding protein [Pseudomonadota bacterium]
MWKFIIALACIAGLQTAAADTYPSRPLRLLVPFTPAGASDIMARVIGQKLGSALGQPVVIENRPGAGGNIGTDVVAKAPADGYTLLMGSAAPLVVAPATFKSLPFDPVKDFAPITLVASTPLMIGGGKELPARDLREFVALAKANPGQHSFGTGSSTLYLTAELLKSMAALDMVGVAYKGVAEASTDVMAGRVSITVNTVGAELGNLQSGRMKALAVLGARRVDDLPAVATSTEQGFPELRVDGWTAIMAPAQTPQIIIDQLNAALVRILKEPETTQRFKQLGFD